MKKLEELLTFLYERREDERVIFQKEKKPDNRNYYIYFEPDDDPGNVNKYSYKGRLMIYIDQENKCIITSYGSTDEVVIEDDNLIKKWSDKIEEYIQEINEKNFICIIEEAFNDAFRKDFHRDWKLKKIFDKEDESI